MPYVDWSIFIYVLLMPLFGISALGLLVLAWSSFLVVTVENFSMSPALEHGDRILVMCCWPAKWLRKGNIVLVWPWMPTSEALGCLYKIRLLRRHNLVPFVKRIVGLPGQTVITKVTDLDEAHRAGELAAYDSKGDRVWHIPRGHIFVYGDNTPRGFDSLTWGPIPFKCVVGLVVAKLPRRPKLS